MVQVSAVILLVIVSLIIYFSVSYMYRFYNKRRITSKQYTNIVKEKRNAKQIKRINSKDLPTSTYSNEYAISFWMNINDYSYKYKQPKVILMRGGKDGKSSNPELFLHPNENNITMKVKLQTETVNETFADVSNSDINNIKTSDPAPVENNAGQQDIIGSDIVKEAFGNISDNSSPSNTNVYNEGFFGNVSGNVVERFESINSETEPEPESEFNIKFNKFVNIMAEDIDKIPVNLDEIVNQHVVLFSGLCKLLDSISSEEVSSHVLKLYELLFDILINYLNDITNINDIIKKHNFNSVDDYIYEILYANEDLFKSYVYIDMYLEQILSSLTDEERKQTRNEIIKKINDNMKIINCDIKLNSNDDDINKFRKNFVIQIVKILKQKGKDLIVSMAQEINGDNINDDDDKQTSIQSKEPGYDTCTIKQVPLQKWVHVVVSVYNDVVDMYLDGKLKSSCVLKGFPDVSTRELYITPDGGFSGDISNMIYVNGSLNQDEVYKIYKQGPVHYEGLLGTVRKFINKIL